MGPSFKSNIARLPLRNALSSSSACAASEQNVGWEHTVSWMAELILRWSRSSLRGACRGGSLKSSLYSSNHVWTKVNRWLREQEAKLSPFNYFDTAAQQKLTLTPRFKHNQMPDEGNLRTSYCTHCCQDLRRRCLYKEAIIFKNYFSILCLKSSDSDWLFPAFINWLYITVAIDVILTTIIKVGEEALIFSPWVLNSKSVIDNILLLRKKK